MKRVRVHRPVICPVCKAEMGEHPGVTGWFKCITCGATREFR